GAVDAARGEKLSGRRGNGRLGPARFQGADLRLRLRRAVLHPDGGDGDQTPERPVAGAAHPIALGADLQTEPADPRRRVEPWVAVTHRRSPAAREEDHRTLAHGIVALDEGRAPVLASPLSTRSERLELAG